MTREPRNPFDLPDWGPNVPLCPWTDARHDDYYVPVGNTQDMFDEFTHAMNVTTLRRAGQLVLATGESGCGKSALLNRCAAHARAQIAKGGQADVADVADVIDFRAQLKGREKLSVEQRLSHIANLLLIKLDTTGALNTGAIETFDKHLGKPDEIYLNLPDALQENRFVIVLLPTSELATEVIRYGSLACRRVMFMIEYALFDGRYADDDEDIREMSRWAPPITLRVGGLKPGDVHRFAQDRFDRHSAVGIYPRMSKQTLNSAAERLRSVAQLQSTFHGTYDARLRRGLRYDDKHYVTFGDISTYLLNEIQNGQGGRG